MAETGTEGPLAALLGTRNSCRAFQRRDVGREMVERVLRAAKTCPTAGNLQSYYIVVCSDAETKEELKEAALGQRFISEAPVVLVFLALPSRCGRKYHSRKNIYAVQDATIACTYAQLYAQSMGLGSTMVGAMDTRRVLAALGDALSVLGEDAVDATPVLLLPMGYPSEDEVKRWERKGANKLAHRRGALTYSV